VACTAAPSTRGAGRVGEGGDSNPLKDRSLWSGIGREKEDWVVNPKLVVIDILFNLLDNVIECADCPGEVSDYSVLGGALVSVVLHRFDKADEQLLRGEQCTWGKGAFCRNLKRVMMQLYSKGCVVAWVWAQLNMH